MKPKVNLQYNEIKAIIYASREHCPNTKYCKGEQIMKKTLALVLALVMMLALCACGQKTEAPAEVPAAAPEGADSVITLRYSHTVAEQEGHPWTVATNTFKETLEKLSGNTIVVETYPGGQLGGDTDLLDSVQLGTLDIGMISSGTIGNISQALAGIDMPFIFNADYQLYHDTLAGEIGQHLLARLEEDVPAMKPLGFVYQAWRHLWAVDGIFELDDMKGIKVRCMQSPTHIDIFNALGSVPTALPYNDIYSNMQTGTIDGFEMDAAGGINSNFAEVCSHMTYSAHFTNTPIILFSTKIWDTLTEEQQGWVREASLAACEASYEAAVSTEEAFIKQLEEQGVEVTYIDLAPFQEATSALIEKYCEENADVAYLIDGMKKA